MVSKKVWWRASLVACVLAIAIGIYKSDDAREYIARQDWLPQQPPWASESFAESPVLKFMGTLTNTSRSSASELSSGLARLGSSLDIHQFQQWLTGAFYSTFPYASDPSRVGLRLAEKGLSPKHPVIIIPGFVTSGLELWRGLECFKGHFRGRLWTQYNMARMFLSNRECWMLHLSLNFTSGLDPEGIRVRNAQGLDAVDFFFPGYDVWASVITSLADIGYDPHRIAALPYDWRLSLPNLEHRDAYFTRLQNQVELFCKVYDERVLLVAHSWGDNVARGFLSWADARQPGWVDKHVAVHFNAAGPTLGVPKALTALLSGELSETANLLGVASIIGEQLLGKEERTLVWRTWGSSVGMLPSGGTAVWGNATWAPDDMDMNEEIATATGSLGSFLSVVEERGGDASSNTSTDTAVPYDIEEATRALVMDAGPVFLSHFRAWSATAVPDKLPERMLERFGPHSSDDMPDIASFPHLHPLSNPLPHAPRMRMYCGYGHGLPTERAYHYKHDKSGCDDDQCPASQIQANPRVSLGQIAAGKHWNLDSSVHNSSNPSVCHGVILGNGDGTVPLTSLGYMCASAWQTPELNPSGMKVVVREYADKSSPSMPRGGLGASAHVEVLRNPDFISDLLHAAAGWYEEVDESKIDSNILEISKAIDQKRKNN